MTALVVGSGQIRDFSNGTFYFTSVNVQAGGTLRIFGPVFFVVSGDFDLASGGMIDGNGRGYAGGSNRGWGQGPGGGGWDSHGGGGGHGGHGGSGRYTAAGGATYDDPADPQMSGSGGGGSWNLGAVAGGAAFILNAPGHHAVLNGTIRMDGWPKDSEGWPGSGGGAGGTINVKAGQISGSGTLSVKGGNTSSRPGGAGGGGCINLCASGSMLFNGVRNVSGGFSTDTNDGRHGAIGTDYTCSSPPTFTSTRTVTQTFTVSPTMTDTRTSTSTSTVTTTFTPSATPTQTPTASPTGTPSATPTWTPTVTLTSTCSVTPTITETFTSSPTVTMTATPGFAASGLGRSLLAPVPAKRGQSLCLYFEDQPARSQVTIYNVVGERVLEADFGADRRPCVATEALAPGYYLVRLKIQLLGHEETSSWQKVALLP